VQYILCTVFDDRNRQYHVLDKDQCVEARTSCATDLLTFLIQNEKNVS
jgi:hypothetical protein